MICLTTKANHKIENFGKLQSKKIDIFASISLNKLIDHSLIWQNTGFNIDLM